MPRWKVIPVHFREAIASVDAVCGAHYSEDGLLATTYPGWVTCFACRKTQAFKATQTSMPMRLREVMAESPEIQALAERVGDPTPHTPPYMNDREDGIFEFYDAQLGGRYRMEVVPQGTGWVEFTISHGEASTSFGLSHLDRMDLVRALLHDFHYSPEQGGPHD